jgi:hypothetical protein
MLKQAINAWVYRRAAITTCKEAHRGRSGGRGARGAMRGQAYSSADWRCGTSGIPGHPESCKAGTKQRSALYRLLAELEAGTTRSRLFSELAREADEQSHIWANAARKKGAALPAFRLDMRTRIVAWLTRRFGPQRMRSALVAMKGAWRYSSVERASGCPPPARPSGGIGLAGGGNLRGGGVRRQ